MEKRQGVICRVSVTGTARGITGLCREKWCGLAPRSQGLEHCRYSTMILISYKDFLQEFSEILSSNSISGSA